jgi:hypothetical protein
MERAKITINYQKIKQKARKRQEWPGKLLREAIGYEPTRHKGCHSCEQFRNPEFNGERVSMCELIGVNIKDPYCRVDDYHKCKAHSPIDRDNYKGE